MFDLKWKNPVPIGDGQFVQMEAWPTPAFWDEWRARKDEIKAEGIRVTKENGSYKVYKTELAIVVQSGDSNPVKDVKLPAAIREKLRSYQVPHTEKLIQRLLKWGATIDGSDAGSGKSFCFLAICIYLDKAPFLMVRKSSISQWRSYCRYMNIEPIDIITPEKIKRGNTQWVTKTVVENAKGDYEDHFEWHIPDNALIAFDEAHYAKGHKTQIGKMIAALRDYNLPAVLLSATIGDNPLHFKNLGFVLRLFPAKDDFWRWARNHGCYKGEWGGLEYDENDREALLFLHRQLFEERGSRIRIKDLPPGAFPETQISIEYVEANHKVINSAYEREIENLYSKADDAVEEGHHLVVGLRYRQIAELQKVSALIELTKDAIDEGMSVCVFVNFIDTLQAVAEGLNTDCVIYGETKDKDRKRLRELFQADKSRVIILQVASGGESISLHDINGKYPRLSLISPPWSAIQIKQVFGRVYRDGGLTKSHQRILIVENSVEEHVAQRLEGKLERIDLINDSDLDLFREIKNNAHVKTNKRRKSR